MSAAAPVVRRGSSADMGAVLALLESAGLPTQDLAHIPGLRMWVAAAEDSIGGVIALQPFGTEGLLRSLAVSPARRKSGVATTLVRQLEEDARAQGITRLTLLTETAEAFFRRLGYEKVDRAGVSEVMRQCAEFRSLCPASATCMSKAL